MRATWRQKRELESGSSSPSNKDSEIFVLEVLGYGRSRDEDLILSTESMSIKGTFSKRVLLGNWYHAKEELRFSSGHQDSRNIVVKLFLVFIRFISIGSSRQNFFPGLTNGFKVRWEIPKKSKYLEICTTSNEPVFVARRAAQNGIFSSIFSHQSEQLVRKGSQRVGVFIVNSSMAFSDQGKRKFTPGMYQDFLAHGFGALPSVDNSGTMIVEGAQESTSDFLSLSPVNKNICVKNLIITPHGEFLDSQLNEFTLDAVNPSSRVKSVDSDKESQRKVILRTSGKGVVNIELAAAFMRLSENWAHFVEDNLPALMRLSLGGGSREVYIQGALSGHQNELLAILFPDVKFVNMKVGYSYRFSNALTVLHKDSRNESINGEKVDLPMIDYPAMLEVRRRFLEFSSVQNAPNKKIFISRGLLGFRKLINLREVESELSRLGFQIVHPEHLNLKSRIEIFGNAEVIVGETGAGMVNCYFAPSSARILELRHPGTEHSQEHEASVSITGQLYSHILGFRPLTHRKLRHGSDSYLIDLHTLTNRLRNM